MGGFAVCGAIVSMSYARGGVGGGGGGGGGGSGGVSSGSGSKRGGMPPSSRGAPAPPQQQVGNSVDLVILPASILALSLFLGCCVSWKQTADNA